MTYIIIDVETTGLHNHPIHGYPQPIQIGMVEINSINNFGTLEIKSEYIENFKPSMPISREATSIHGILYKDLLKCRKSEDFKLPENICYIIAHNAKYEKRCLGNPDIKFICTMDLARKIKKLFNLPYPNAKLETLIEHFYPETKDKLILPYHNALNDAKNTLNILQKLITYIPGIKTFEELDKFITSIK